MEGVLKVSGLNLRLWLGFLLLYGALHCPEEKSQPSTDIHRSLTSRVISFALASSFECFHSFIKACPKHTGRAILFFHSGENLALFYILQQKPDLFLFVTSMSCLLA